MEQQEPTDSTELQPGATRQDTTAVSVDQGQRSEEKHAELPAELTPQKVYPPIDTVQNGDLTEGDMSAFISAAVDHAGIVGHNVEGYNQFLDEGIPNITTQMFDIDSQVKDTRIQTAMDKQRESIRIQFRFTSARVGHPIHATYPIGEIEDLYPNKARIAGLTYSAPLTLTATVKLMAKYASGREDTKTAEIPSFQVSNNIPVMLRSNRCHTYRVSRAALKELQEDPNEPGGYFIAGGQEYVVELLENIRFNGLHVHRRMVPNEIVRGEFISQPGGAFENSSQLIVRLMTNGSLTVEINSTKLSKVRIPFYLLYRLFGMTSDREIVKTVVFDLDDRSPVIHHMLEVLEKALRYRDDKDRFAPLRDELDRERIVQVMAERLTKFVTNPTAYKADDHAVQYLNTNLLRMLDRILLPHMGTTRGSRTRKLRYLGWMIHNTFLVKMDLVPPTDRDSFRNKRVHGAGTSIAKAFKTHFNKSVIGPILRSIKRLVKNQPFEEIRASSIIDAFRSPLASSDLNMVMQRAITAGNRVINTRGAAGGKLNRLASSALERKSYLNMIASLRTITTHSASAASKQTERADMMRRVHPSLTGLVCVARSADTGEKVGLSKELAITASVCPAGDVFPLKSKLYEDPEIIALDRLKSESILRDHLATVMVNGELIGCCINPASLVTRYRRLRREGQVVDPRTTIVWTPSPTVDVVEFLMDVGRLARPLLVVDSNVEEYDAAQREAFRSANASHQIQFVQNIRLTRDHVKGILQGQITMGDLIREGVAEYITAEEQENCLVAESLSVLRESSHDVTMQYTHCDIEEAIFGISALVSPLGNHTQPARVTYQTNQGRQTGGWHCFSAPFRADKNRFFQFYNEVPLVKTIASRWVYPNGMNAFVAYAIYGGDNQEDSAIMSRASVDRGLFSGSFYRFEKAELEKGERFQNPDILTTKNLKPRASYDKLVNGFVPVGTVVRKGDVLIGRVGQIQRRAGVQDKDSHLQFIDRSVVYRLSDPAVVDAVWTPRGEKGDTFGLVKLRYERPLGVGDKMSSRSGNKSIAAVLFPQSDMPFTESGMRPDIIINPHAIPTRMTIGQKIETLLSKLCARKGITTDGTSFRTISLPDVVAELQEHGFRFNGRERMYNGQTGEPFDAAIFFGPTYHQRLQKFVLDDEYAVASSGPTDAVTGQPLDGKNASGGLRIGEMEAWVLESHGALMSLHEKFFEDSDKRPLYICRTCCNVAVYNEREGIYNCKACGPSADIAVCDSSKSATVFLQELMAANTKLRFGLRPRAFEA